MRKRNWLKTTIAMITLIATVLETGFTSVSTLAAEITTEDGIVVNNDAVEEVNEDAGSEDLDISVERERDSEDVEDADYEEEEAVEEATELKEGSLSLSDDQIAGSGYDDISIYVDTEGLDKKDMFRIEFEGPASASYNPIINDDLDKTSGGRYDFEFLEGGDFTVRAVSSDDVTFSYRYNEDGYPTIVVESIPAEKILESTTLTTSNGTELNAISGEGYDKITVKFNCDELSDSASYKLYVESEADATVDGMDAKAGIDGLANDVISLEIENLDEESFKAYVVSDNDKVKIKTFVDIDSVEDGIAVITVDNDNVKRVYEYEDNDVYVKATLEVADAIPDDADFVVTKITPDTNGYNYDAYIQAINDNADTITGEKDSEIDEKNVLLYDVAFFVTDKDGNKVEVQPEEGSVRINIQYKKGQLKEELEANDDSLLKIVHLPLVSDVKESVDTTADATDISANDINVEVVSDNTSVSDENSEFALSDFSVIATIELGDDGKMVPGTAETFRSILGDSVGFGIVGNEVTVKGDLESTMAVGKLHGNADFKGPKNEGKNPGISYIGSYDGTNMIYDQGEQEGSSELLIYTTETAYKNMGSNMYNNGNGRKNVTVDTTTYSEEYIQNMVAGLVKAAQDKSDALAKVKSYLYDDVADGNVLDIKSKGTDENGKIVEGTYYVTFNKDQFNKLGKFTIKLGKGQNVVFNIPDKEVYVKQYVAEIDGVTWDGTDADPDEDPICQRVFFNAPNATESHTGNTSGLFLFPYSDYSIGNVSAGWIIADKISEIGGLEWHFVWHDLPSSKSTKIKLYAKKTLDDDEPDGSQVFKFDLYKWNGSGTPATLIQTKENHGQDISFDEIPISAAGWYSYIIVEQAISDDGYVIDAKPYNVQFWVDKVGNKLEVTSKKVYRGTVDFTDEYLSNGSYWSSHQEDKGDSLDAVEFKNYTSNEINHKTYYEFPVEKTVKRKADGTVIPVSEWPTDFTFTLSKQEGYEGEGVDPTDDMPLPKNATLVLGPTNGKSSGTFGRIELNAKDLYDYSVENRGSWGQSDEAHTPEGVYIDVRNVCFKYKITETIGDENGTGVKYDIGDMVDLGNGIVKMTSVERGVKYIKLWINIGKKVVGGTTEYQFVTVDAIPEGMPQLEPHLSWDNDVCFAWDDHVPFTNEYNEPKGQTKIYGKKILEKKTLNEGDYSFTLTRKDTGEVIGTASNDKDGYFSFVGLDGLKFNQSDLKKGKVVFTLTENNVNEDNTIEGKPGVVAKTKSMDIEVTLTLDKDGNIEAHNPYDTESKRAEFKNTYKADGDVEFYVKKVDKSKSGSLANKPFKFQLTGDLLGDGTTVTWEKIAYAGGDAVPFDNKVIYSSLDSVGTHEYTITEVDEGQGGVKYETRPYNITVVVADGGNGKLTRKITAGFAGKEKELGDDVAVVIAEFENDYNVTQTSEPIDGSKTLHGKDLDDNEFTFKLEAYDDATKKAVDDGDVELPKDTEVNNNASGAFSFGNIIFHKDTTGEGYKFKVSEIPGEDSKYEYDGKYYIVTIPVDDVNGQLTVDPDKKTITDDKGNTQTAITFDNYYHGEGEVYLFARKNLSGRTIKNGEFTFTLESNDGHNANQQVTNNGSTVAFEKLEYTTDMLKDDDNKELKEKKFTYTIKETVPDAAKKPENVKDGFYTLNGVYYDKKAEKGVVVTVTVTRNADGSLTAKADKNATSQTASEVEFDNAYKAENSFDIDGYKAIMGRKFVAGDEFEINLVGPAESKVERHVYVDTAEGNSQGTWSFKDISFNQDNYKDFIGEYTVTETNGGGKVVDGKPVVCDRTIFYVYATITDDEKGHINYELSYYKKDSDGNKTAVSSITFINTYDAEGSVSLSIHKGYPTGTLERGKFNFYLNDATGRKLQERKNGYGAGNEEISPDTVIFDEIKYELNDLDKDADGNYLPKVFTYTIGEEKSGTTVDGITYNTTNELYTVNVTVSNDGNGKLKVEKVYKNAAGKFVDEKDAKITNEYHTSGEAVIYANKILNGRTLKDGAFTFLLKGEDNITREASVVANKDGKSGKATFDPIVFNDEDLDPLNPKFKLNHATKNEGEYARYFTLREKIPEEAKKSVVTVDGKSRVIYKKDGYTYDGTIYSVVVTLKDDGKGTIDTDWVVFAEGDVQPDDLKWYQELWDTVKSWFGADKTHQNALFTNDYESTGAIRLKARKVLTGKENKAGAFSFILKGEDENGVGFEYTVATKEEVDENGKTQLVATFPEILYTQAKNDGYTYTIKEFVPPEAEDNELNGVHYDTTEYKVIVTVTEKDTTSGNGKLLVTAAAGNDTLTASTPISAKVDNKDVELYVAEPVTFTNTYDAEPVSVTLGGNKTLSGRDLVEGDEFSFVIAGEDGTKLPEGYDASPVKVKVVSGELGTFSFPEIKYELSDLADDSFAGGYASYKDFKYLVTEVIPSDDKKMEGITYDDTEYHVVVRVTNSKGKLTAKITSNGLEKDEDDIADFENKYNANGDITFSVLKKVVTPDGEPVAATDKTFNFVLTGDGITTPYTASAVNGARDSFSTITYTLKDLGDKDANGKYEKKFSYKVEEVVPDQTASDNAPTKGGYKYTDEYFDIVVTVTSNGKTDGGKLNVSKKVTRKNRKTKEETDCGDIDTFEFDNVYYAFGGVDIEGNKSVSEDMPADKLFHFALFDEDGNQIGEPVTLNNGGFKFHLDYTQADIGTHNYSVKEVLLDGEEPDPTIIYDDAIYAVKVVVGDRLPDEAEGTLHVSKTITKDKTEGTFDKCYFSNTKVLPNSLVFKAKKTLTGKALEDSMFKFTLTGDGQDQTVYNHGEDVEFEAIEYKLSDFDIEKGETEKTYNYTVKEEKSCTKPGGMSYIKTDYTAVVKVSVVNGKIVIDPVVKYNNNNIGITVTDGKNGGKVVKGIEFVNKYEDDVKVLFGGFKHLNGFKDGATPLGTYKFELKDVDNNKVIDTKEVTPDKANEDKLFDFDNVITFTQADLMDENGGYLSEAYRHFTVKEVIPTIEEGRDTNVTYATNVYKITVKLSFDNDGNMVADVSSDGLAAELRKDGVYYLGGMGFTNTYAAEGNVVLGGVKTIEGKNLEEKKYTFTLFDESGSNVIHIDDNGKIVADGGKEQVVQNAGKEFTFAPIVYDETDLGDYTYIIRETLSEDGSVVDSTEYKAVVSVANGTGGKLAVSKKYYKKTKDENGVEGWTLLGQNEKVTFKNTFEAEGEVVLEGLKKMYNKPLKAGDFTFIIKDENGNVLTDKDGKEYKAVCGASALNNKDELLAQSAFKFDAIKYDQNVLKTTEGTFLPEVTKYYTVEEHVTDRKGGIVYSQARYGVEVTIKLDKVNKKLDVSKVVKALSDDEGKAIVVIPSNGIKGFFDNLLNGSRDKSDDIVFTNRYDSKCVIDPPILRKQIMGRKIERGEFEFSIVGAEPDKAAQRSSEKYKNGYANTVRNGYAFDEKTGKDQPYYYDHDGVYHELPEGEIFVGDIQYKFIDLDVNLETGEATRTFEYIATEIPKKGDGVGYTPQKFKLTVTVTDNNDGTLVTNPDIKDMKWEPLTDYRLSDEQMKDTFLNTFNQEGSVDIVGVKNLNGRKLTKDDVFEFTLTDDATGKSVTVNNTIDKFGIPSVVKFAAKKADGSNNIDFLNYRWGAFEKVPGAEPVNLVEVDDRGTHTYTLVEEMSKIGGIVNDKAVFKITVEVKEDLDENGKPKVDDKGHGTLNAKVTKVVKVLSQNNVEDFGFAKDNCFEFTNEFKAKGTLDLNGIKILKDQAGNSLSSPDALRDQYEFALYQYKDEARKTGKTLIDDKRTLTDGSFKMDTISYDQEILKNEKGDYENQKVLYYQIEEVKPSSGTWTENNTVFESDGVIYDLKKYNMTVTIDFDGSQTLKVSKVITDAQTGEVVTPIAGFGLAYDISFTNIVKEYTTVEGNKYWIDNIKDPKDRPTVTVNLYRRTASGVETKINSYDIVAPDTTYRFSTDSAGNKLPTNDSAGRPIKYIVEETPIEGYLSEKVNYDFYNTKEDILIRKIDADTRTTLSGATLAILDGSTEIERWTSGVSAHVVESALTAGKTYTLHEVSAPEGYGVADDMTFTVPSDGSGITVTMSDPPIIGSVRLTKVDASTRETLAGAEFALYNEAGTRIYATGSAGSYRATTTTSNGVFVTDGSGSLTISDLPYGTYYFVETKAPDGYALSTDRLGFTIVRGGELVEVTYVNTKAVGSVRLRKIGSTGTRGLAGAVFELYAATPRSIGQAASSTIFSDAYYRYGTYRTNAAGEIYVGDLPWDDYYFVEVDAPDGYEIMTDVNGDDLAYTFRIDASSTDRTIELGDIINNPEEETPPPRGGVLGERVKRGGVVNGVLGVRAKPNSGVLGERIGPVTGDASNIILWSLLLAACIATIVATVLTGRKKKAAK